MRALNISTNLSDLIELHQLAAAAGSRYADSVHRDQGWSENVVPSNDEIESFWGEYLDAADALDNPNRAGEEYFAYFASGFGARWQELG